GGLEDGCEVVRGDPIVIGQSRGVDEFGAAEIDRVLEDREHRPRPVLEAAVLPLGDRDLVAEHLSDDIVAVHQRVLDELGDRRRFHSRDLLGVVGRGAVGCVAVGGVPGRGGSVVFRPWDGDSGHVQLFLDRGSTISGWIGVITPLAISDLSQPESKSSPVYRLVSRARLTSVTLSSSSAWAVSSARVRSPPWPLTEPGSESPDESSTSPPPFRITVFVCGSKLVVVASRCCPPMDFSAA